MGKSWVYIGFATIMTLIIIILSIFLMEISTIITLGNRVENSLIGAGWAGFSTVDLDEIGERKNIDNAEIREIYLDKAKANLLVKQYIRQNLKLDTSYRPTNDSYIVSRDKPVVIDEIRIFNPDELPIIDGKTNITRTTIKIAVEIPMDIKGLGFRYAKKTVYVDIDTF
ncbi:MAG: hypothetical protein WCZ27_09715 [Tissierellaceae bacterium]